MISRADKHAIPQTVAKQIQVPGQQMLLGQVMLSGVQYLQDACQFDTLQIPCSLQN